MERVTFTNAKGQSITLGNTGPYILINISGTGAAETDVQMQKAPFQDGQTYIDNLLEPRVISIETAILASTKEHLFWRRREISQIFNPKLGQGMLKYEYDGGIREIQAVSDLAPVFPVGPENQLQGFQRVLMTLICPSPFWLDEYEESEEMVAWLGGLQFALMLPTKFSEQGESTNKIIRNDGDVATPVLLEFFGPAVNPKIENSTTGEYIRLQQNLTAGQKLVINTGFGNKYVKLVEGETEINAMHWLDLNSTFWQLQPGGNYISYSADAGAESAWVKLTWKNRYVGV